MRHWHTVIWGSVFFSRETTDLTAIPGFAASLAHCQILSLAIPYSLFPFYNFIYIFTMHVSSLLPTYINIVAPAA